MNPWHVSIDILNCMFIVQQGYEGVDQVCKTGLNRCDKVLLLDPAVNLCIPESPRPLMDLLRPGYALLHIRLVNSVSISPSSDLVGCTLALQSPANIYASHSVVNRGLCGWKTDSLVYFDSTSSLQTRIFPPPSLVIPTIFDSNPKFSTTSITYKDRKTPSAALM